MVNVDAAWWERDRLECAAGDYVSHFGEIGELLAWIHFGDLDQVGEIRAIIEHHRGCLDVIEAWMDEYDQPKLSDNQRVSAAS